MAEEEKNEEKLDPEDERILRILQKWEEEKERRRREQEERRNLIDELKRRLNIRDDKANVLERMTTKQLRAVLEFLDRVGYIPARTPPLAVFYEKVRRSWPVFVVAGVIIVIALAVRTLTG